MPAKERRFIANVTSRKIDHFKRFAEIMAKLKPHGRVLVDASPLADKAFHIVPPGGSAWHEYAANWPALHRFFPHPKLAPHIPADFVKKNQALLAAKVKVLEKLGLDASFHGNDPHFWPESFWQEYPHLRGPRIDHPRRSRKEEFSVCADLDEGREMLEWELTELRKHIPMLGAFIINTNDAGSGFCWAAAQYSGPNGPQACRGISAGKRVRRLMQAFHDAARSGGGDVSTYINNKNFWQNEMAEVVAQLPDDSYVTSMDPTSVDIPVGSQGSPARGLINPLAIIRAMEKLDSPEVHTVFLRFGPATQRGDTHIEAIEKGLEIVIDCIEKPVKGLRARLDKLHSLCTKWAGEKNAEALLEAFNRLDQAMTVKQAMLGRWFGATHGAVSMRHMTRPLVINPELLAPEEEDYFLPYIFNIHETEARNDYIDLHGRRMTLGTGDELGLPALDEVLAEMRGAASVMEKMTDAPEGKWLMDVGTSTRIYASMIRSTMNFFFGQKIRDRHGIELAREEPHVPVKAGSWDGEGQILAWNELMRDELDNTNELLALFKERGTDHIFHAEDNRYQSPFLFGPDLVGDLEKKIRVMRDHWLDVERYLAPPHK